MSGTDQRRAQLGEDESAAMYRTAHRVLSAAGYEHYEVSGLSEGVGV